MEFSELLKNLDIDFFGNSKHKISIETLLQDKNSIFLDIRTDEEIRNLDIRLEDFVEVKRIPTNEIPERMEELSKDKTIGVFCPGAIRASIVWAYLYSNGFKNAKIAIGGYQAVTDAVKTGKVYKNIQKS